MYKLCVTSAKPFTSRKLFAAAGVAALLVLARPSIWTLVIGGGAAALGLALRVWATGYLVKNERFTREGPYRWVRHPLYLGTWLIATGALVAGLGPHAPQPWALLLLVAFQLAFFGYYLPRKDAKETARLTRLYGEPYLQYRALVPSFGPRFSAAPLPAEALPWSLARVGANSEWGTLAGTVAGFAFLTLRCGGWLP